LGIGDLVPEGDHDGVGEEEEGEPEPEECVKLLVHHVQGQHAQPTVSVHSSTCSGPEIISSVDLNSETFEFLLIEA